MSKFSLSKKYIALFDNKVPLVQIKSIFQLSINTVIHKLLMYSEISEISHYHQELSQFLPKNYSYIDKSVLQIDITELINYDFCIYNSKKIGISLPEFISLYLLKDILHLTFAAQHYFPELFKYFNNTDYKRITIKIGECLSHVLINWSSTSIEKINSLDRKQLARDFIKYHHDTFYKYKNYPSMLNIDNNLFINDIAIEIDYLIPKIHMRKCNIQKLSVTFQHLENYVRNFSIRKRLHNRQLISLSDIYLLISNKMDEYDLICRKQFHTLTEAEMKLILNYFYCYGKDTWDEVSYLIEENSSRKD